MQLMIRSTLIAIVPLRLASCATTVGAGKRATVPEDSTQICASQCEALGLKLDALAIGDRYVNCICEPAED